MSTTKVAIVQSPPILLNKDATIQLACDHIREAANQGAELIMFPETYIPGYPTWMWRLRPGNDGNKTKEIHALLRANSVDIDGGDLDPICDAARDAKVTVALGLNEIDSTFSGTTLYNSLVIIGADGFLLNRHRKLMPTNPERMVWGQGDGSGLRVVDTPVGRIGGLICWENYMPLARYTLYAQNIDIFLSPTWDNGDSWQATMRHIATEGGCWVLSCATAMQGSDVPDDFPYKDELFPDPDEWVNDGGAVVMKPFAGAIAGPMNREKATLYAEIDISAAHDARRSLDVTGHYSRPDIFDLHVDRSHRDPATFED